MFKNVKINDRVFDYMFQEFGVVIDILVNSDYSIHVEFSSTTRSYTYNGMNIDTHATPQLFWDKVDLIIPPKRPLPNLKVDTKVRVWNDKDCKERRYFSHFDEHGEIYCFMDGATSWSTSETIYWENWELADE